MAVAPNSVSAGSVGVKYNIVKIRKAVAISMIIVESNRFKMNFPIYSAPNREELFPADTSKMSSAGETLNFLNVRRCTLSHSAARYYDTSKSLIAAAAHP